MSPNYDDNQCNTAERASQYIFEVCEESWFIKLFFRHQKVTPGWKPSWEFVYLPADKTHYLVVNKEEKKVIERNISLLSPQTKR